ncbi:SDR family NAD(P)-dependent oxidoreductase [Actinorhabdospora filicis]
MEPVSTTRPTVAVILAGGTGQRIGMPLPKQLLKVSGKAIIEHTIDVFEAAPAIDDIYILMTPDYVGDIEKIVASRGYAKVRKILPGGGTRADTTRLAIEELGERDCNILLHDAVRPLIDRRIIDDCVAALEKYDAIDVAIPSSDTIVEVTGDAADEVISAIPDRSRLRRGQTPQGFALPVLRRAYELAAQDPDFTTTDDCGVVHRYLPDVPIHVVAGSEHNMKVTHPIDVYLADRLFQLASGYAPAEATPEEYRAALAGKTMVVFGGSYGIGEGICKIASEYGAAVHSFSRSSTGTHIEDPEHVAAALKQAFEATGRVDFVVNTAGILHKGRIDEYDEAAIEEALRVNYLAPVHIARLALPYLRESKGSLLLYTSSSYTRGRSGYSLYSSAKAATVNLTQALADEWAEEGVRVNCVNPERTATPMRTKAFGDEPSDSLLAADLVSAVSVDVLISELTGHVIDVRRPSAEPLASGSLAPWAEAEGA